MEVDLHVKCDRGIQLEAQEADQEKDTDEFRGQRSDHDRVVLCRLQ